MSLSPVHATSPKRKRRKNWKTISVPDLWIQANKTNIHTAKQTEQLHICVSLFSLNDQEMTRILWGQHARQGNSVQSIYHVSKVPTVLLPLLTSKSICGLPTRARAAESFLFVPALYVLTILSAWALSCNRVTRSSATCHLEIWRSARTSQIRKWYRLA